MNVVKPTKTYESWAGQHIPLIAPDLKVKHKAMAEPAFPFLRATFYRWVDPWAETCLALAETPELLAIGGEDAGVAILEGDVSAPAAR